MARVLVLVLVALISAAAAQDSSTTLGDEIHNRNQQTTYQFLNTEYRRILDSEPEIKFENSTNRMPLSDEIRKYIHKMQLYIISNLASDLGNLTVQQMYVEIDGHCAGSLTSLTVNPGNMKCVTIPLLQSLKSRLKKAIKEGLEETNRKCYSKKLSLCTKVPYELQCTNDYQGNVRDELINHMEDVTAVARWSGSTPLDVIQELLKKSAEWLSTPYTSLTHFITRFLGGDCSPTPSDQIKELILSSQYEDFETTVFSELGSPCSNLTEKYKPDSTEYSECMTINFNMKMVQLGLNLLRCAYTNT